MPNETDRTEIRKDQIRNAAFYCFSKFGFNKTTMDDIAGAIGMKKASLYYYYKSKEAVFCETFENELLDFLESAEAKVSRLKSAGNKLLRLVDLEFEYMQEKIGAFNLSVNTILETQPLMLEFAEKVRQRDVGLLTSVIHEGIQNGEFKNCNASSIADSIRTILDSIKLRELQVTKASAAADIDYEKISKSAKEIITLIINGLKK